VHGQSGRNASISPATRRLMPSGFLDDPAKDQGGSTATIDGLRIINTYVVNGQTNLPNTG
jgi:hypothetical protein